MMTGRKRLVAVLLALTLVASLLPLPEFGSAALAVGSYGRVTDNGVRVRKQPSTSADYWFKLDAGYVCAVTNTVKEDGVTWYKVNAEHPDPNSTRTYVGYIHGDFFKLLTDEEAAAWEANPVQNVTGATNNDDDAPAADTGDDAPAVAPSTSTSTSGKGEITASGVNFRETEGGPVIQKLDRGTVVELLSIPSTIDENHWYRVRYNGYVGYIQAPFIRVISTGGLNPGQTDSSTSTGKYVKLILSSANLRLSPGGTVGAQWEKTGEVIPVIGSTVKQGGYTWYPVRYNNKEYYVRGDCVLLVNSDGSSVSVATPTPTPEAAKAKYVKLVLSSANLRLTPGGKVGAQWETTGEILAVTGSTVKQGGYTWYPVRYNGNDYYVRGDCVQVVSAPTTAPVTPTPVPSYKGYVKTILSGVNLRLKPAGEYIQQVDKGLVLPMLADVVVQGGYGWYYVQVDGVKGYIRGDCVVVCDKNGNELSASVTTPPSTSANGYVKLTQDKVNLRSKPAGTSLEQLPIGQILPMTGSSVTSGNYVWYPVRATSGKTGYVRGDCAEPCDKNGNALDTDTGNDNTAPSDPGATWGYIKTTVSGVNFRKTPGGTKIGSLGKNEVYPMTGKTTTKSGYTWYPVQVGNLTGYVRGDCAVVCDKNGNVSDNSSQNTAAVSYVQTVVDKVNLRASASKDAHAPYNVALGTVMAYNTTKTVGGSKWYRVVYNNTEVWVLGSCVKVMTAAEYQAYLDSQPAATPQPEVVLGYVITTTTGVNLRNAANGNDILGRIDKGVVMPFSKEPTVVRGYTWYYVKTAKYGYGYVRGDCVEQCEKDGSALPTTPPTQVGGQQQEASYTTLKLGSKGTEVKKLVTALKEQGYYTGTITSTYTTAVQSAVKAFQKAKGLTVDGIAGPKTQHALFGTVEPGTSDTSNLTMAIYPAEKIDWYTGGINTLWAKGANYKVYDVKTGIVWWAHRWSGGSHVDAEPLTAADTQRLCKIYGVSSADQIEKKNLWQRRPMLVTIGNRTFACSLYGIPHNYPDGDTISTNDFKGQLCIHFTNSKTHTSNKVDSYHQEAIDYAWKNAPNGHK